MKIHRNLMKINKRNKADNFAVKFYKFGHAISESFKQYIYDNTDFWCVRTKVSFFNLDDNCSCEISIYGEGIGNLTDIMKNDGKWDYDVLINIDDGYKEDWTDSDVMQAVYKMYDEFVKKGYSNFAVVEAY